MYLHIHCTCTLYVPNFTLSLSSSLVLFTLFTFQPAFSPGHTIFSPTSVLTNPSHATCSSSCVNLTPVVTTMSPGIFTLPLPKLELDNISNVSLTSILSDTCTSPTDSPVSKSESFPLHSQRTCTSTGTCTSSSTSTNFVSIAEMHVSCNLPLTPSPHATELELPSIYFQESKANTVVDDSTLLLSEVSILPITPVPSKLHVTNNLTVNFSTPSICNTTQFCDFSKFDDTQQDLSALSLIPQRKLSNSQTEKSLSNKRWVKSIHKKGNESTDEKWIEPTDEEPTDEKGEESTDRAVAAACGSVELQSQEASLAIPDSLINTQSDDSLNTSQNVSMSFTVLDGSTDGTDTSKSSLFGSIQSVPTANINSEPMTASLFIPMITPISEKNITSLYYPSPNVVEKSNSKTSQVKAMLDTARFDAESFLATLKNKEISSLESNHVAQDQDLLSSYKNAHTPMPNDAKETIDRTSTEYIKPLRVTTGTVLMESSDSLQSISTSSLFIKTDSETYPCTKETTKQVSLPFHCNPLVSATVEYTCSQSPLTDTAMLVQATCKRMSNRNLHLANSFDNSSSLTSNGQSQSSHSLPVYDNTQIQSSNLTQYPQLTTAMTSQMSFTMSHDHLPYIPSSCASYTRTSVDSPPSHTSTPICKPSLAYCTPMLSSAATKTSFHALPMTESPISLYQTSPPSVLPCEEVKLPEIVVIDGVSCIHTRRYCQLSVKNKTERWLQYKLEITAVWKDPSQVH